jgi:predicted porin
MKKSLVALAALAATSAFAQSSVSITGLIDAGYKSVTAQDATASSKNIGGNNAATSQLVFQVTEDLGGGLKALFKGQQNFNAVAGQTGNAATPYFAGNFFNDEIFVGLEGGFGRVRLGTPASAQLETNGKIQPFGTAMGGGYSGITVNRFGATTTTLGVNQFLGGASAGGRVIRHERTARYDTPNINGFAASYATALQNDQSTTATSNNNGYTDMSLTYGKGPLNLAYAATTVKAGANVAAGAASGVTAANSALTANAEVKYTMLGGNYTMGAITVYYGATTGKSTGLTTNIDVSSSNVAAKYALSPKVDLMINSVKVDDKVSAAKDQKLTGLGADYKFSKNTNAYLRYEDYNTDKSATNKGVKATAVGLVVKF